MIIKEMVLVIIKEGCLEGIIVFAVAASLLLSASVLLLSICGTITNKMISLSSLAPSSSRSACNTTTDEMMTSLKPIHKVMTIKSQTERYRERATYGLSELDHDSSVEQALVFKQTPKTTVKLSSINADGTITSEQYQLE